MFTAGKPNVMERLVYELVLMLNEWIHKSWKWKITKCFILADSKMPIKNSFISDFVWAVQHRNVPFRRSKRELLMMCVRFDVSGVQSSTSSVTNSKSDAVIRSTAFCLRQRETVRSVDTRLSVFHLLALTQGGKRQKKKQSFKNMAGSFEVQEGGL